MREHLPSIHTGHERLPDIAFARGEPPLVVGDRRGCHTLVDINELSRRLSIAKGTLYNWVTGFTCAAFPKAIGELRSSSYHEQLAQKLYAAYLAQAGDFNEFGTQERRGAGCRRMADGG